MGVSVFASQEWSPSHNLKSLRKKQLATREAMARQTVVSDTELSVVESSVIRCPGSPTVIGDIQVTVGNLTVGIPRHLSCALFEVFVPTPVTEESVLLLHCLVQGAATAGAVMSARQHPSVTGHAQCPSLPETSPAEMQMSVAWTSRWIILSFMFTREKVLSSNLYAIPSPPNLQIENFGGSDR